MRVLITCLCVLMSRGTDLLWQQALGLLGQDNSNEWNPRDGDLQQCQATLNLTGTQSGGTQSVCHILMYQASRYFGGQSDDKSGHSEC